MPDPPFVVDSLTCLFNQQLEIKTIRLNNYKMLILMDTLGADVTAAKRQERQHDR